MDKSGPRSAETQSLCNTRSALLFNAGPADGSESPDATMMKDRRGRGWRWETLLLALPLPINCCLVTKIVLAGLQAAIHCLWLYLGMRLLFAIRVNQSWQRRPCLPSDEVDKHFCTGSLGGGEKHYTCFAHQI